MQKVGDELENLQGCIYLFVAVCGFTSEMREITDSLNEVQTTSDGVGYIWWVHTTMFYDGSSLLLSR